MYVIWLDHAVLSGEKYSIRFIQAAQSTKRQRFLFEMLKSAIELLIWKKAIKSWCGFCRRLISLSGWVQAKMWCGANILFESQIPDWYTFALISANWIWFIIVMWCLYVFVVVAAASVDFALHLTPTIQRTNQWQVPLNEKQNVNVQN